MPDEVGARRKKANPAARTIMSAEAEILAEIRKNVASPVLYDLGCGQRPEPDYVGIDLFATGDRIRKADLYVEPWAILHHDVPIFDMNAGEEKRVDAFLRIPDDSVDLYHSSHFLEHVPDWYQHFREIWRTLKMGSCYIVKAPYYLNKRFFQDPDHKQPIFEERLAYLSYDWLVANQIEHGRPRINFSLLRGEFFYNPHEDFANDGASDEARAWNKEHLFNVIDDIAFIIKKEPMPEGK